jgi:hypothetical protein
MVKTFRAWEPAQRWLLPPALTLEAAAEVPEGIEALHAGRSPVRSYASAPTCAVTSVAITACARTRTPSRHTSGPSAASSVPTNGDGPSSPWPSPPSPRSPPASVRGGMMRDGHSLFQRVPKDFQKTMRPRVRRPR